MSCLRDPILGAPRSGRAVEGGKDTRQGLRAAYGLFLAAFREAEERLKAGDRQQSGDPAGCPTGPPTDPDVRVSRLRLFEIRLRGLDPTDDERKGIEEGCQEDAKQRSAEPIAFGEKDVAQQK